MSPVWQLIVAVAAGGGATQLVNALIGRKKVDADAAQVITAAASQLVRDYVEHHVAQEERLRQADRKATLACADAYTAREEAATARAGEARCHARLEELEQEVHELRRLVTTNGGS